jgi:hypothetical protein
MSFPQMLYAGFQPSFVIIGTLITAQVPSMPSSIPDHHSSNTGSFMMLEGGYARDGGIGYAWQCQSVPSAQFSKCWVVIPGCDGYSLEAFGASGYARDKTTAYIHGVRIEGSDSGSFQVLNQHHAKDKTGGYSFGRRITGSDGPSFETLNDIYAHDLDCVYCRGTKINEADRGSFKTLGNGPFAMDNRHVYSWDCNGDTISIPAADPQTFKALGDSYYGIDKHHAFYGHNILTGADANTLEVMHSADRSHWYGTSYARDRGRVYWMGRVVGDADSATFCLLGRDFAADQFNVFLWGKLVQGVERSSFRMLEAETKVNEHFYACAEDRKHWYCVTSDGVEKLMKAKKRKP